TVQDAVIAELRVWNATNTGIALQALEASLVVTGGPGAANNIAHMSAITPNFHTETSPTGSATVVSMLRAQTIPALTGSFTIGTAIGLEVEPQTVGATNY